MQVSAVPFLTRFRGSFVLRFSVGCGLIAVLCSRYDLHSIVQILRREDLRYFAAAVALYIAIQMVSAFRWQMIGSLGGFGGTYSEYLKYYLAGMFANVFCPGLIAGDAARAYWLAGGRDRLDKAVASVMVDRGIGLIGLFVFTACTILASPLKLPREAMVAVLLLAAMSLVLLLAAPAAVRGSRFLPPRLRRIVDPLIPYLRRPPALAPAAALSGLLQASLAGCQYLLALGLGLSIPIATVLCVVPIGNLITSIPVTFNGLGLRDTTYLVLFGLVGVSSQNAVALGLLWFACTVLGNLSGLFAIVGAPAVASDFSGLQPAAVRAPDSVRATG